MGHLRVNLLPLRVCFILGGTTPPRFPMRIKCWTSHLLQGYPQPWFSGWSSGWGPLLNPDINQFFSVWGSPDSRGGRGSREHRVRKSSGVPWVLRAGFQMLREVQGDKEGSPSEKVAQRLSSSPRAPAPCSFADRILSECWVACQGSLLSCSENVAQILRSLPQAPWLSYIEKVAQRLSSLPQAPCSLQEYRRSGCCLHPWERIPGPSTHFEVLPSSPPSADTCCVSFLLLDWLYTPQIPRPDSLCDCVI